ncbi:MAG: hypothetical protein CBD97_03815 [Pelagibacteraceae bacterium TMED237]|nr:hypothetical protein [Candidatus Neomarinimicrobiota bacterium]OUW95039.1 MAG: hypothetical protein CBD97_03815 [Pelagibacteraceae bacterium TMED237]|tara:strand:- start:827 stop:1585 length:759 start_codon:yes stop_codon:yes gene_type:complete
MISKAEIKILRSLENKKGRETHNLILVEGKRIIKQLLNYKVIPNKVWATQTFIYKNTDFIKKLSIETKIYSISHQDIKKTTKTHSPSGIICIVSPAKGSFKKIARSAVILDNIADPGNLGTILRTSSWFGVNNILLSEKCVDPYNPKVVRAAMGAHFNMNIICGTIHKYIERLKSNNFKIIAADLKTKKTIRKFALKNTKWALLMGSEAHGLTKSLTEIVDEKIKIPQFGQIESLNVSVACGIFLYHITKIK